MYIIFFYFSYFPGLWSFETSFGMLVNYLMYMENCIVIKNLDDDWAYKRDLIYSGTWVKGDNLDQNKECDYSILQSMLLETWWIHCVSS